LYTLQRRSGTDREGVRLTRSAVAVAFVITMAAAGAGCAGPLANDGSSASVGSPADGTLRTPVELPMEGDGYAIPARWRPRHSNWGTEELVGVIARAARAVSRELPGGVAPVGDLSRRGGGASVEHRSHQNGRDVDVFFYSLDAAGRPARPGEAMIHYGTQGQAVRWSPAKGLAPPAAPVPAHQFDAARNWAFVRALLTDEEAEVQWIFIDRPLAALLLKAASEAGEDPALVARASVVMHAPSDSERHDDHMHVRLYCDPADRSLGCVDRGPTRWLKKSWKYMAQPFGRADRRAGEAARDLRALMECELPLSIVPGALRS
jgi:penicillin-insensitive murein endopeptidase